MKNELTDKELFELFKNDSVDYKPDPSVKSRLDYTLLIKESQRKIHQNSFAGLFAWLVSFKSIPVKAALVSAVLLFSVFNFQQKQGANNTVVIDTASVSVTPFNLDSACNSPFNGDTCSFPGI